MAQVSLSVVIPAYNEERNLRRCVDDVVVVLGKTDWDWEVIVVNDGSSDRTGEIAKQLAKRIAHLKVVTNKPNRGYGGSLKAGFARATKELVCFVPADGQYDFAQIHQLLSQLTRTSADIVSGVRTKDNDPLHRRILRWVWNKLVYALFGHLASDIDCGFKLFRRQILEVINLPSDGAMIDTQLFAGARAREMRITEVPVTHLPRTAGKSTGGNLQVAVRALGELLAFWWQLRGELWVEQGRAVFRWELVAILAVLLIASGLRLYRIADYMTFLGDEGRDAIVMREIVTLRHWPLIGPGTSIGSMYLGPWYYYLTAPSLWLAGWSPVGPSVQVALIGVLTVALLWWIGRQWFGRIPALLVSLLYSLSPTVIIYSRSSWNPNVMAFFALLTIYGIWKVWRLNYWHWLVITAVSFAMVLNSHYLGLLLLPTIGLFLILSKRKPESFKFLLFAICIFIFLMFPLVWFDARHGWNNFAAMQRFFTDRQTTVNAKVYKTIPHLWPVWRDMVGSVVVAKQASLAGPVALAIFLGAVISYWRSRSRDLLLVAVWLGMGVVGLGLYKQHIYDHYYGFMSPAPFLLLGFGLGVMGGRKWRWLAGALVAGVVAINLINTPLRQPPNYQLARTRDVAEFIGQQSQSRPFNLALIAQRNYDAGYRYFLDLGGAPYRTIHQQLADQLFVICEQPHPPEKGCDPIGHPLWEIAAFGWAKVDRQWEFPWGVKLFKLVPNPTGK